MSASDSETSASASTTPSEEPPLEFNVGEKLFKRKPGQVNPSKLNEPFPIDSGRTVFWAKGYLYQAVCKPGNEKKAAQRARSKSRSRSLSKSRDSVPSAGGGAPYRAEAPPDFVVFNGVLYRICPLSQPIPASFVRVVEEVTVPEERGRSKTRN